MIKDDLFLKYLKRKLHLHEAMLNLLEPTNTENVIREHQLLYDQLEDIIQHYEEFVKDGMDNS